MKNANSVYCRLLVVLPFFWSFAVDACEVDVSRYVGWTIVYSGTVTGYIDESGQEESSFEGCEYGRVIIVDYTKQVVCSTYRYAYAYHPDIVVLANGAGREACIDDRMYNIQ